MIRFERLGTRSNPLPPLNTLNPVNWGRKLHLQQALAWPDVALDRKR